MCGIAGIIAFNELGKEYFSKIDTAVDSLAHRGPDERGIYKHEKCTLGHRRLAIIDTSNQGAQPFTDISGRYTIVFNGEIFNFKLLRKSLEDKDVVFKSQSDTEVLLYLYITEEEKCVKLLDGEFSFAIFDQEKESIFIARDRFGIKPLYIFQDENRFVFASEMKALLHLGIPKTLDHASLQTYFHLNYIPAPYSIFQNVYKFDSGHYAIIDSKGEIIKQSYYSINKEVNNTFSNYDDATKELRNLLIDSVEQRMISDVPLGAFLSGGIDSSIITAIAAKRTKHLNTFSIGYKDEPRFDETKYAQLVAKRYKTNHTAFQLSNDNLYANLHTVLDAIDEPFADSSALAVNILCMHAKKHVTVALSGDGADEIFAGYNKHAAEFKMRNRGLKENTVGALNPLFKHLPKSRNSKFGNIARQLSKFSEGTKLDEKERYWRWAGFGTDSSTADLLITTSPEYPQRKSSILKHINSEYNSVLYTDMELVLQNDMLVKVDRMSMNQSLEVRVPFLDHKFVDFSFGLSADFKINASQQKRILKDAFKNELPNELYNRNKQGFEVPLLKWFQSDLKSLICDDLLSDTFIREQNIFNPEAITSLKLQLFSNNPDDAVAKTWAVIVFQHWWKKIMI